MNASTAATYRYRRIGVRLAALAAFIVVLMADASWVRHSPYGFASVSGYVGNTALVSLAVVGITVALTPAFTWRTLAMALIIGFGWVPAVLSGILFVQCGGVIGAQVLYELKGAAELSLMLPYGLLFQPAAPFVIIAGCCAVALLTWAVARALRIRIPLRACVIAAAASPAILVLSIGVLKIAGMHAVPSQCDI